jgi:hypothetical protein
MNRHFITEIIAPTVPFDCKFLIKYYPQIEKLDTLKIKNIDCLKQTKLKYLRMHEYVGSDEFICNLPDTIEYLILMDGYGSYKSSSFDQLNKFPHLNYLQIRNPHWELSTTLGMEQF